MSTVEILERIQTKLLWLSTYMVHHANALRANPDGTKVGGHQASSSSVVSLMTALYFAALRPGDVVATKAHASPVLYAIQYLRGRLPAAALERLREFEGLQAYPSRRKNPEVVDLSTGSMGLGAVAATFGAVATRYLADHFGTTRPERFIAVVGDAELDEGNVWEALLEEIVTAVGHVLWIVDVNRQSLDRAVPDARRHQLPALFRDLGWHVIELRWGRRLQALFREPSGDRLRSRLEAMTTAEYQGLLRLPAAGIRKALLTSPRGEVDRFLDVLLEPIPDSRLYGVVADLGGHDLPGILAALEEADHHRDRPCVILAQTVKGWGLPLAADPMNHGALLSAAQIETLRETLGVRPGEEWTGLEPGSPEDEWNRRLPALFTAPAEVGPAPEVPETLGESYAGVMSSQEALGRALGRLSRLAVGDRIVTISADVAVTTHLAGWISRRGVYFPLERPSVPVGAPGGVPWVESPRGQHLEFGIAENNLFLALGAFGLTRDLSGQPLVPIGTLYDPFVSRGLDALYHALYSQARFIVAATPSGVSLSPEGGAHQSVVTPGLGLVLPGITYFEPVFAQEIEWILLHWIRGILDGTETESLYLRLSTKPVDQALAPRMANEQRRQVLQGGYRLLDRRAEPGWDPECNAVHLFAAGVMVPEALAASRRLAERGVFASVFAVTSPDRLYRGLRADAPYLEELVSAEEDGVPIVSVIDGHSHALAFLGSALGTTQAALGVDDFGQSGARRDLYRHYAIDAPALERAALSLLAT